MSDENSGLGWWSISGEALLEMLHLAHDGEDPDMIYAEEYANSDVDPPTEQRVEDEHKMEYRIAERHPPDGRWYPSMQPVSQNSLKWLNERLKSMRRMHPDTDFRVEQRRVTYHPWEYLPD